MFLARPDPSTVWPEAVELIEREIGFDAGYMAATWGTCLEARGAVLEHDELALKTRLGLYLSEISTTEVAAYTDRACNFENVWPTAGRRQELSVFREVLWPTRMRHMLVRVSVRSGNVVGINLERRGISSAFSEQELALVDAVAPLFHILELLCARDDETPKDLCAEHGLGKREAEFATLSAKGLQNQEIALLCGVSLNTVRNTLVRVFEKVGASNRAELAFLISARGAPTSKPNRRAFDDGTNTFRSRLGVAAPPAASPSGPRARSRVVYTAPMTPTPGKSNRVDR
jgi:DNA-binding CsgD family transcriptional regulator